MNKFLMALSVSMLIILNSSPSDSFDENTHEQLSERAVRASRLDNFLKNQLALAAGIQEVLSGKTVDRWIQEGSIREDEGLRFCNHFHNPLRTWDQAGLRLLLPILCGTSNQSAVVWGQDLSQGFSWQFARDEYFKGLTATNKSEREDHLANTFRALGQLIHLVQDAGQPAHTRNDPHPIVKGFEGYVENIRIENNALFDSWISSSLGFDQTILTLPPNPLASIPIARIIDTTDPGAASAFPSAGTDQGIAEYSNANFLSWDTIFKDFVFPRVESLGEPFDGTEPVTGKPRRYFPKVADGDTGYRLVAEGTFWEKLVSLSAGDQGYILDRGVFEDYAARLLPRAIGYSAGLIDYFFRNRMGGSAFDVGCSFPPFQTSNFNLEVLSFPVDTSLDGEQTGTGRIVIVVHYRSGGQSHYFTLLDTIANVDTEFGANWTLSGAALAQVPADATDLYFVIAYRGPLGKETDAVIGGLGDFIGLC